MKIMLPSLEEQKKAVDKMERLTELAKNHVIHFGLFTTSNQTQYLELTDEGYTPPTGDQVKFVVSAIMNRGYTKCLISRMIGVSDKKNRTILRWERGGDTASVIPYCAWRHLLSLAGLGMTLMVKDHTDGSDIRLIFSEDSNE